MSVHILLQRHGSIPNQGTFGTLVMDGFTCLTLEREWLNNQPWVSCIPAGVYDLERRHQSTKTGAEWEVMNVPGRTDILIHVANQMAELAGCIALGYSHGCMVKKQGEGNAFAVLASGNATGRFNNILRAYNHARLEIRSPSGHVL